MLPTQTATAIYYLFMDAVMISQASFFALRAKRRKKALQALLPSDTEAFDEEEACDPLLLRTPAQSDTRCAAHRNIEKLWRLR